MNFTKELININAKEEVKKITAEIRSSFKDKLKKRGAVVGVSGGIDSSVVLALCAKAVGSDRTIAVMLPEKESNPDNLYLTKKLINHLGVRYYIEDLTAALEGLGCYSRRNDAIKRVFPEFDLSYKAKILLPGIDSDKDKLNVFSLQIISAEGKEKTKRIPYNEYLEIVAASNFKQRSRMSMLYFYAEANNYAVVGTANKNEHEQGFFVKYGDGGADIKPIAHLFKTQVFQLADYLDIPEEIRKRTPTTDTYSAEQTQEEFFFRVPFDILDRVWYGWENGYKVSDIAKALNLSEKNVEIIKNDIERKIKATEYLRMEPL